MIELTLDSDLNRLQCESLLLVHSLVKSLLLIIDDMLDISKVCTNFLFESDGNFWFCFISGGGLHDHGSNLLFTVFDILKTFVIRASQNNLDLTDDVGLDIPNQLISGSLHLRQVITNLVGNAIKFTPSKTSRKGRVALSTTLLVRWPECYTWILCDRHWYWHCQRQVELDFWHLLPGRWLDYW